MKKTRLKIRLYGDPCLRKKAEPLEAVRISERVFIDAMVKTMYETDGIGLAATQVGVNKSFFVADMGEGAVVFVNPKIIHKSGSEEMEEGCLSFPGIVVKIKRPKHIVVEYMDENNQTVRSELSDLPARIFLHEYDHLNARMIIDHASAKELKALGSKLKEIEALAHQS